MATMIEDNGIEKLNSQSITLSPKNKGLRRMFSFVAPYKFWLVGTFLAMILGSALSLVLPLLTGLLVDTVFVKADRNALNQIVIFAVIVFIIQAALVFAQSYLLSYTGERVLTDLRRTVYTHLQKLSLGFFNEQRSGDLMARVINDVSVVRGAITGNLITFCQSLIMLLGGVTLIILRDWRITLLIVLLVPLVSGVAMLFGRRVRKLSNKVQEELGEASSVMSEAIANQKTVKAFVRESYEVNRFNRRLNEMFKISLGLFRIQSGFSSVMTFLGFSLVAIVLWYGSNEVLDGHLSPGELVSVLIYMGFVIGPVGQLANIFTEFQKALGAAQRVFDLLDTPVTVTDAPDAKALPPVTGLLRFEDVDFSYDSKVPVLRQFSFEAQPGQVVALVGSSGAGKTTIANLIPRFFDPIAGRITVDGHDIKTVQQDSLREQIGIVPQEPVLFAVSIRENIAYGRLDASFEEIEQAARAANAHEFIEKLPDGYDSLVGERGVKLSGGQRQRIAIARAILRNPRILILDEATSSLDNESESLVQEALDRLMRDRTTIVIAHRLSTIENADKIVVIERGQLIEEGTHTELLANEGLYHRLYTRNFEELGNVPVLPSSL